MQRIIIYRVIILLVVLTACDTQRDLLINGALEKDVQFYCGEVKIKPYTVARSIFTIEQVFTLREQIVLYKDSLKIKYKGELIDYTFSYRGKEIEKRIINVINDDVLILSFNINNPLPNPGDTVTVQDNGYLYCNGHHLGFDEILLIIE